MNCVNCYHYQACASVDVTGYVTDREKGPDEVCEHFLNPEDVRRTAHWARKVHNNPWSDNVKVQYECTHCGTSCEITYSREFFSKDVWFKCMNEFWMPKYKMPHFCHGCGAEMDLDKTDHSNVEVFG